MNKITELMPDDMPDDVREAMESGQLAAYACELSKRIDLHVSAQQRALKRWQKAHPDKDYWPDLADNIVWLLDELAQLRERHERAFKLCRGINEGITAPFRNNLADKVAAILEGTDQ